MKIYKELVLLAFCFTFCHAEIPSLRTVDGFEAADKQFPFQISLKKNGSHDCGGSILNEKFILTAAHCVAISAGNVNDPKIYTIVAGTNYLNENGVERKIKRIIVHENYANHLNDIALLELNEPLEFSDRIKPIEMHKDFNIPTDSKIIISGWGRVYQNGPLSNVLKFNTLSPITTKECQRQVGIYYVGLICLSHPPNNGACNGDSGGPAIYNGKLVGVGNFIKSKCGSNRADGYAKVPFFAKWIQTKITE